MPIDFIRFHEGEKRKVMFKVGIRADGHRRVPGEIATIDAGMAHYFVHRDAAVYFTEPLKVEIPAEVESPEPVAEVAVPQVSAAPVVEAPAKSETKLKSKKGESKK